MGCCFLLQRIFLTQGSNPNLLHLLCWQANSLPLCQLHYPKVEEDHLTQTLIYNEVLTISREGNGNPLQYSCLENPMDGGAWWAAVYGVAQSRTRLKQLSSSSSLTISCNLLNAILRVKNRVVLRVQNGSKCISCLPCD